MNIKKIIEQFIAPRKGIIFNAFHVAPIKHYFFHVTKRTTMHPGFIGIRWSGKSIQLPRKTIFIAKKNTKASSHDILDDSNEKMTQIFESAEYFFEQYKNIIIGVLIAIVALIAGWWSYNNLIKKPKEQKEATAILHAQNYFEMDSQHYALKVDGAH